MNTQEESENHWPGYVDALTTMTMMLIFVMMILSVAIFSFSENVSRSLVEKVAQSAGIDAPAEGQSVEDYTETVMAALEARKTKGGTMLAAKRPDNPDASPGGQQAGIKTGEPPPAARTPGEERIIESNAGEKTLSPEKGIAVQRSEALITLTFKPRATALDEGAQKEMRAYLESAAKAGDEARFDLKAYAGTDTGALSDARRVAYYRAMAVRAELIANGIPALRISVHVLDQTEKTDPHRVQIFTRTKTAAGGETKDLRG